MRRSSSGDVPRPSPAGAVPPGNQADAGQGPGRQPAARRRHTHSLDLDGSSGHGCSPAVGAMSSLEEREREAHGNLPALELPVRRGVSWSRSVGAKGGAIAEEVPLLAVETCSLLPVWLYLLWPYSLGGAAHHRDAALHRRAHRWRRLGTQRQAL